MLEVTTRRCPGDAIISSQPINVLILRESTQMDPALSGYIHAAPVTISRQVVPVHIILLVEKTMVAFSPAELARSFHGHQLTRSLQTALPRKDKAKK